MDATVAFDDVQVMTRFASAFPAASFATAWSVTDSPTPIVGAGEVTVTTATGTGGPAVPDAPSPPQLVRHAAPMAKRTTTADRSTILRVGRMSPVCRVCHRFASGVRSMTNHSNAIDGARCAFEWF